MKGLVLSGASAVLLAAAHAQTLRVHPDNPRLFEHRGEAAVLRTFGEHYGAVVNPDFDYVRYLDSLAEDGLNLTRVVLLGFRSYEKPGEDPLTPAASRFLQPWQRAAGGGMALDGAGKWDFTVPNEVYFTRLRDFVRACGERGIAVELCLFNTIYINTDDYWHNSPFHPSNNVQGYGPASRFDAMRGTNANLTAVQEAAVRRIVRELNGYDHIYYEIQNEPFWNEPVTGDAAEVAFHNSMLAAIRSEESLLPKRHLVAHNFPEQSAALSADFDVINCHYPFNIGRSPFPPIIGGESLLANFYHLAKPLSLDESSAYNELSARIEAWMFVIGGGAVYNGLDSGVFDPNAPLIYSIAHPEGDVEPGPSIRASLGRLGEYSRKLRLAALRRDLSWVVPGSMAAGARLQAMSVPGQQHVAYMHHGTVPASDFSTVYNPIDFGVKTVTLQVNLAAGNWRAVWTRPGDLSVIQTQSFSHAGGVFTLAPATYQADVVLRIDRTGAGDATPPPVPRGVAAAEPNGGSVALTWTADDSAETAAWHVYHATSPGVQPALANRIAVIPGATLSHAHAVAAGSSNSYVVTAVDANGNESAPSAEVLARPRGQAYPGPFPFVPGVVQCENFDSGGEGAGYHDLDLSNSGGAFRPAEGVDIAASPDTGGGHHVTSAKTGEWLEYTVRVLKTDTFTLGLRCNVPETGAELRISADGGDLVTVALPVGAWQTVSIPDLRLDEGLRVLRITITGAGASGMAGDFNWFSITPKARTGPNAYAGPDLTATDTDWSLTESFTFQDSSATPGTQPVVSRQWIRNGSVIATGAQPTVALEVGTHRIVHRVTDAAGWTDEDEVVVTVRQKGFVNGGFESGLAGWSTTGNVILSATPAPSEGSALVVFNDSNSNPNGALSQTFPTIPGQAYRLTFETGILAFNTSSQTMTLDVSGSSPPLARSYTMSRSGGANLRWFSRAETFIAAGSSATITFRDVSAVTGSIDLLLDKVRLTRVLAGGVLPELPSVSAVETGWRVRVEGPDVGLYRLLRSENLTSWTQVAQRQMNAPGWVEFTDDPPEGGRFFYRVGLDQPP